MPPCGEWSPALTATTHATLGSKVISLSVSAAGPAACTNTSGGNWGGTYKLLVRRNAGATAPTSPTEGTFIHYGGTFSGKLDFVQRSDKQYSYAVFACESIGCETWYAGNGAGAEEDIAADPNDQADDATTEKEVFRLTGVTGSTDMTHGVVRNTAANAPDAVFYPSDWGTNPDGLAVWYSIPASSSSPSSQIYRIEYSGATTDGFPTDANTVSNWSSSQQLVAEGQDGSYDDYQADHPWVMLTDDGTDQRVQLFVQSQWDGADNDQVIQIESTDDLGADFGLGCSTTCADRIGNWGTNPGTGYLAIEADGGASTDYIHDARHGRIAWDYIANGAIDPSTGEPKMVFMLQQPSSGACADDDVYDNIGWADGSWSSGPSEWLWDVLVEDVTPECRGIIQEDGHDPAILALPNGELKMYYKAYYPPTWHVVYWDGNTWDDDAEIEFRWSTGSTGPAPKCVENIAAANHLVSGGAKEAIFFRLADRDAAVCGVAGGGFDDDVGSVPDDAGIVFAQLENG